MRGGAAPRFATSTACGGAASALGGRAETSSLSVHLAAAAARRLDLDRLVLEANKTVLAGAQRFAGDASDASTAARSADRLTTLARAASADLKDKHAICDALDDLSLRDTQFGLLGLNPPTNLDAVEKAVADLKARKTWYSEQPRGSVKTAQEIRKENAKATAKIRGGGGSDENGGSSGSKKGSKKGFDASGEDFAPLGSGGASSAVNANWGQKATEEAAATEDPTPAAAAEE